MSVPSDQWPLTVIQHHDDPAWRALVNRFWAHRCAECGGRMPRRKPQGPSATYCSKRCTARAWRRVTAEANAIADAGWEKGNAA